MLRRAEDVIRRRRFRVDWDAGSDAVAAERGHLREAGNLLFHLAVIVVLVGVAVGSLFGYKGGVIMFDGKDYGFSNNLTQYDDFAPGSLFDPDVMEPFSFDITDFDVDWLTEGDRAGMAREFVSAARLRDRARRRDAGLRPQGQPPADHRRHRRLPHRPRLRAGHHDPRRRGQGHPERPGGVPADQRADLRVLRRGQGRRRPAEQIGLEGTFYPTFAMGRDADGNLTMPSSVFGYAIDPLVSMSLWTGDLGIDDGTASSVYVLDKADATQVLKDDGQPFRMDLRPGDTVTLPDGLGTVTFEGVQRWNKIQISRTPRQAGGARRRRAALVGLLGSLFVRPRRMWVRARRQDDGTTLVEVARLDRSSGGDPEDGAAELGDGIVAALKTNRQEGRS